MSRHKLSAGLGRLVTNTIKLVNRIFGRAEPPPRATPSPRPQRPTPPVIQQTVISKSPIVQDPTYQNQIDELKKIIEQQQREIEQLKAEREEARRREAEEIEPPFEVMDEPIEDTPRRTPEPAPVDVSDEDDELPFEYTGPDEDWKVPAEDTDYTWQNFGSVASLDYLTDFLKNTELSGVRVDSPFFNLPPIQQHFILIDYVQYQHDANPALFYQGKKKVELENVPIWGAEFDRFIDNMTDFGNTNTGDGRFGDTLPDWLNDLIEEY